MGRVLKILHLQAGCLVVALCLCSTVWAGAEPGGRIRAFVSILPQAYFVERVGGGHVQVDCLVGPGQSPETYEPTPKQMTMLGRSDVYFRIGAPFEKGFVDKIRATFKDLKVVDTRNGVTLRYFRDSTAARVPDPHTWLDPKRVKIQAGTICTALSLLDPAHAATFERNMRAFMADLEDLDAGIARILAPVKGRKFYVFHPAFGYFGDSYGLTQVAVEVEGKEPTGRQLAGLIEEARADGVKAIFVQPQHAKRQAEAVARVIGAAVMPLNPLPRDYLKGLEEMAAILRKGLLGG